MVFQDNAETLPLSFESYSLNASHLYFRLQPEYLFLADNVSSTNGVLSLQHLSLLPLLSPTQFKKYFPQKNPLLNIKATSASVAGLQLKKDQISLKKLNLSQPNITFYQIENETKKNKKPISTVISIDEINLEQAKIEVQRTNLKPIFSLDHFNFNLNHFTTNSEKDASKASFNYENFKLTGENLNYFTSKERLSINKVNVTDKNLNLKTLKFQSLEKISGENYFEIQSPAATAEIKSLALFQPRPQLKLEKFTINEFWGTISTAKKVSQNSPKKAFNLQLFVGQLQLHSSKLKLNLKGKKMLLNSFNLTLSQFQAQPSKNGNPNFKTKSYDLDLASMLYEPDRFYKISTGTVKMGKNGGEIRDFKMVPKVSRAQFIKMIPHERDLYTLEAKNLYFRGNYDLINSEKFINLSQLTLNNVDANIFRSKLPPDDLRQKPLYSRMLRSIKFPLFVENLDLKNSVLVYEEDIPTSDGPGKLIFKPFNMQVKNINSAKQKQQSSKVNIVINTGFMNGSPLHVNWSFDTRDYNDHFGISGNISDLPAARLNPFIEPYLHITATGLIKRLDFNFNGDPNQISGVMEMHHDNLKIAIKKKDSDQKNKFLSAIANLFIKSDSDKFPESVQIKQVERDPTKSFFNLFWRGLQDGLAQTLIGVNYKKSVDRIKATKQTIDDVKSDIKQVKKAGKKAPEK